MPYLCPSDSQKLIFDAKNLLNDRGLLYISFIEGDPYKSGFQIASSGDRIYFNYHNLENVITQREANSFEDWKLFKVEYQKSEVEKETHTIVIAKKKANA